MTLFLTEPLLSKGQHLCSMFTESAAKASVEVAAVRHLPLDCGALRCLRLLIATSPEDCVLSGQCAVCWRCMPCIPVGCNLAASPQSSLCADGPQGPP